MAGVNLFSSRTERVIWAVGCRDESGDGGEVRIAVEWFFENRLTLIFGGKLIGHFLFSTTSREFCSLQQ